jgi:hypothetical protein
MMPAVPPDFLPPDPHAEAPPAPQPASRPVFLPPNAGQQAAPQPQNSRAVAGMIVGSLSLGLLFFTGGVFFFVSLPASIVAWVLGHRAKRSDRGRDQANVAVIIGIVGVVLGVIAAIVWILLFTVGDYSTTDEVRRHDDGGLTFDLISLVAALR